MGTVLVARGIEAIPKLDGGAPAPFPIAETHIEIRTLPIPGGIEDKETSIWRDAWITIMTIRVDARSHQLHHQRLSCILVPFYTCIIPERCEPK